MPLTRRELLRSSTCAALGAAAASSAVADLFHVAAAAETKATDYKALVCVFLGGGNDGSNVIVPRAGSDYAAYAQARTNLALAQAELLPVAPIHSDGRLWGFHPSLGSLQALFAQQKLAVVANVGPLLAPLTRGEWLNGSVAVPPQLFSHSDQQIHWQTSVPDQPVRTGWGGRAADVLRSSNGAAPISMAISLAGANTFLVGQNVLPYQMSTEGSFGLAGFDPDDPTDRRSQAIWSLLQASRTNLFEGLFAETTKRAIDNDRIVRAALEAAPLPTTVFPETSLGAQLRMVTRLVSARAALGFSRQVFFCETGGFDTHGPQLDAHAGLLADLSQALAAFYAATVELGVANDVTTFTASDFGRTYASNGEGSDHGWGNPHFVLGGSVKGGDFYGRMPVLAIEGPDDTDLGRWIPSTSVDEYGATLARWFGVPTSSLNAVFPNLGRFAHPNLGFMP